MLAFSNVTGGCFALNEDLLAQGFQGSRESPRKRIILPLHRRQEDVVQRMLNFFQPGTYVQPHIHPEVGQSETVFVLRGCLGFIVFEADGEIRETHQLRSDGTGLIDIEPGLWHGMVCLEPDSVILETKKGPYDAASDKSFAKWAPAEGEPDCEAFRQKMESLFS